MFPLGEKCTSERGRAGSGVPRTLGSEASLLHQRRDDEALDFHVAMVALDDEGTGLGFIGIVGDGGEAFDLNFVENLGAVVDDGEGAANQPDVVALPLARRLAG